MANFNYLAINDTTELGFINERLAVNVKAIAASYKMDSLAAWTQAKALADISREKLYVEDFKDMKAFAEYIDISPARISQRVGAVQFLESDTAKTYGITADRISTMNAYLIGAIKRAAKDENGKSVKLDDSESFIAWAHANIKDLNGNVWELPLAKLKEVIQEYKEQRDAIESEGEEVTSEEVNAPAEEASEDMPIDISKLNLSEYKEWDDKTLECVLHMLKMEVELRK